ncbi:DUF2515 family protein [Fictibacillus sp. 23RED33]|uniref:DUF2515 family protein n=1 Tax=Fictibacillus sp. 23RED33 TaxID=2745879 RepID=UPI0018CEF462|nr:DUF2515 family protein [Fictibacillus sp. 23RED33]MBH0173271.1 DUF2515 family protein [Fictibacillus sp. 23RED33]
MTSKRLFTKLTLIPFEMFINAFPFFHREKVIWQLSKEQRMLLQDEWKRIKRRNGEVKINLQSNSKELVRRIREETKRYNKNNVTRTTAYLTFYNKHPEISWSFLAHMVSRNAGYFMSDLKGEFLPHILEETFLTKLYDMLEKGNSMIFEDAYPQLLLYEESKRTGISLFHLSHHFNISPFIEGVWEIYIRQEHQGFLLPVAQIINEQSHIEKALVQTEEYKELLNSITYRLQEWLKLSQILFPTWPLKQSIGRNMNHFKNLDERIRLGQNLYSTLFQTQFATNIHRFANAIPHTGSRCDYDHKSFTAIYPSPDKFPKEKLSFFKVKNNTKIYSPFLLDVWKHNCSGPYLGSNWFDDEEYVLKKMKLVNKPSPSTWMTYWSGLHKIESVFLFNRYYKMLKKNRNL